MFYNCTKLKSIKISMYESLLIDASFAFSNCISLENVLLKGRLFNIESTENMFENCFNLTSINLIFLKNNLHLKVARGMFKGCFNLLEINFPDVSQLIFDLSLDLSSMFMGCTNLKNVTFGKINSIGFMESMFYDCKNLAYLNIYDLYTKNTLTFDYIFEGIEKKIEIEYDFEKTGPDLQLEINKNKKLPAE